MTMSRRLSRSSVEAKGTDTGTGGVPAPTSARSITAGARRASAAPTTMTKRHAMAARVFIRSRLDLDARGGDLRQAALRVQRLDADRAVAGARAGVDDCHESVRRASADLLREYRLHVGPHHRQRHGRHQLVVEIDPNA